MATAQQLASRRRATKRPRRSVKVRAQQAPRGLVLRYTKALRDLSIKMNGAVWKVLSKRVPGLKEYRPSRYDANQAEIADLLDLSAEEVAALLVEMREALEVLGSSVSLLNEIDAVAQGVSEWTATEFARQVQSVMGIDIRLRVPEVSGLLDSFRSENLDLIVRGPVRGESVSLTDDKVDRIGDILSGGENRRVETIAGQIQDELGITDRRAALIARDQVLGLNGDITQARHEAAGIEEYTWSTSKDERVRPGHAELEGTRQRYDDPPVIDEKTGRTGNPGDDFQCRCVGIPIIEGFDEATGSTEFNYGENVGEGSDSR